MELAEVKTTGARYSAEEFLALPSAERETLRRDLACVGCGADAYYVQPSRNGRPACFGARPHGEPCDLASQATESIDVEVLTEAEQRSAQTGGFTLRAADEGPITHTRLGGAETDKGKSGKSHTAGDGSAGGSYPGLKLNRLLRLLVSKPGFAESHTPVHLEDGTTSTIRRMCVRVDTAGEEHRDRERIYWGTIRYSVVDEDGGAWLNTGSRHEPTIRIGQEQLQALLQRWELESVEDLDGAVFASWSRLRRSKRDPQKYFLFVSSLATFVVIPEDRV